MKTTRSSLTRKIFTPRSLHMLIQITGWIVASNFFIILKVWGIDVQNEYLVLTETESLFMVHLQSSFIGAFVGLVLFFLDDKLLVRFNNRGFTEVIIIKSIYYLVALVIICLLVSFVFKLLLGATLKEALIKLYEFMSSIYFITTIIYGIIISCLFGFIKQVDSMLGPGTLLHMFTGKYHKPCVEERIFMFLDLKDSTTHAENLGHVKYSQLLQDCFSDLTSIVEEYKAYIYQYVGDEVVLTWKASSGLQNTNCLRLFFSYRELLHDKADEYKNKYGFVPEFKAGMNWGQVSVATVGQIKKEIAYHGDVLNVAARIQELCNSFKKGLLISEQLRQKLVISSDFKEELIDKILLKGKRVPIKIYSVDFV